MQAATFPIRRYPGKNKVIYALKTLKNTDHEVMNISECFFVVNVCSAIILCLSILIIRFLLEREYFHNGLI